MKGSAQYFPTIDKRETGTNLRRIMDQYGITVKDVQQYLGLGSVQSVFFKVPMDAMVCGNKAAVVRDADTVGKPAGLVDWRSKRLYVYYEKFHGMRAG